MSLVFFNDVCIINFDEELKRFDIATKNNTGKILPKDMYLLNKEHVFINEIIPDRRRFKQEKRVR